MKSDIKKILKDYYEHMCGVDDYGCDLCIKYEKQINKYIDQKMIEARIEDNKKWLRFIALAEELPITKIHFEHVITVLEKELKELKNES